jgi:hypothetical protein
MEHAYYASPFGAIAMPMIFAPLAAIWFIGRGNLIGKQLNRWLSGTALFWFGAAVLVSLTGVGLFRLSTAFIDPKPAILVSTDQVTCRFDAGRIALPWHFVTSVQAEVEGIPRRGVTVHRHYAVFRLDPRYIDHLPWNNDARRTREASCGLDDFDVAPEAIYRVMAEAWRAARG